MNGLRKRMLPGVGVGAGGRQRGGGALEGWRVHRRPRPEPALFPAVGCCGQSIARRPKGGLGYIVSITPLCRCVSIDELQQIASQLFLRQGRGGTGGRRCSSLALDPVDFRGLVGVRGLLAMLCAADGESVPRRHRPHRQALHTRKYREALHPGESTAPGFHPVLVGKRVELPHERRGCSDLEALYVEVSASRPAMIPSRAWAAAEMYPRETRLDRLKPAL